MVIQAASAVRSWVDISSSQSALFIMCCTMLQYNIVYPQCDYINENLTTHLIFNILYLYITLIYRIMISMYIIVLLFLRNWIVRYMYTVHVKYCKANLAKTTDKLIFFIICSWLRDPYDATFLDSRGIPTGSHHLHQKQVS